MVRKELREMVLNFRSEGWRDVSKRIRGRMKELVDMAVKDGVIREIALKRQREERERKRSQNGKGDVENNQDVSAGEDIGAD